MKENNLEFKIKTDHHFGFFNKSNLVLTGINSYGKYPEKGFVVKDPLYLNDRFYSTRIDVVVSQPSAIISSGDVFVDFKPNNTTEENKELLNKLYRLNYGVRKIIMSRDNHIIEKETNYLLALKLIRFGYLNENIDFHNLDSTLKNKRMNLHNFGALLSQVVYNSKRFNDVNNDLTELSSIVNSLVKDVRPSFSFEELSLTELLDKLSNLTLDDYKANRKELKEKEKYLLGVKEPNWIGKLRNDTQTFIEGLKFRINDFPEKDAYLTIKSGKNIYLRFRENSNEDLLSKANLKAKGKIYIKKVPAPGVEPGTFR